MKPQIKCELFNQANLHYNLRKDVKLLSCNIKNVSMVPRDYHIFDEKSETWTLPKTNPWKQ